MFRKAEFGFWLGALALLHTLVGLVIYRAELLEWLQAGFFNAVEPSWERMAAFWFLMFGWVLFLLGQVVSHFEQQTQPIPQAVFMGWLALSTFGMLAMPFSGFPLCFILGLLVLFKQRRLAR